MRAENLGQLDIFEPNNKSDSTLQAKQRVFNETYKDWISAYNADIEKNGLWCDGQAAWNAHANSAAPS